MPLAVKLSNLHPPRQKVNKIPHILGYLPITFTFRTSKFLTILYTSLPSSIPMAKHSSPPMSWCLTSNTAQYLPFHLKLITLS